MNIEAIRATTEAAEQARLATLRSQAAAHKDDSQAKWYALLDHAKAAIRAAADAGKYEAEVVVPGGREQARDLAGHFQADGFACTTKSGASEDGYPQSTCLIRW